MKQLKEETKIMDLKYICLLNIFCVCSHAKNPRQHQQNLG